MFDLSSSAQPGNTVQIYWDLYSYCAPLRAIEQTRDLVLVHFGFGRVASLEFSPAFQSREESVKRLRRVATLEFIRRYATGSRSALEPNVQTLG
jgi:hypothetical protein